MKKLTFLKILVFFVLPFILIFEANCGNTSGDYTPSAPEMEKSMMRTRDEIGGMDKMDDTPGSNDVKIERKIIYSARLSLEVENYQEASDEFVKVMKKYEDQCYIHSSSARVVQDKYMETNYTIKINPEVFDDFINDVKKIGKVTSESRKGEDITEKYIDLVSRLENKENTKKRMEKLLDRKNNNLKDLLSVEREIERISQDIEVLKGKIKYYDNLVSMATLNLEIDEKIPRSHRKWKFNRTFKDSIMDSIEAGWAVILFFITISIPTVIIIAVLWFIIWIIVKLIIRAVKKGKKKKEE